MLFDTPAAHPSRSRTARTQWIFWLVVPIAALFLLTRLNRRWND